MVCFMCCCGSCVFKIGTAGSVIFLYDKKGWERHLHHVTTKYCESLTRLLSSTGNYSLSRYCQHSTFSIFAVLISLFPGFPFLFLCAVKIPLLITFSLSFSLSASSVFFNHVPTTVSRCNQRRPLNSVLQHFTKRIVRCTYSWRDVRCVEASAVGPRSSERLFERKHCGDAV